MYENSKLQKKYRVFIKNIVTRCVNGLFSGEPEVSKWLKCITNYSSKNVTQKKTAECMKILNYKNTSFYKDIVTIRIGSGFFFVTDLPGFQFLAHLATQVIDVFVEVNKFFDNYL